MKHLKLIWIALISLILVGLSSCGGDDDVAVSGVAISKTTLTLKKGATETLVATVNPVDATDASVKWHSSDESVVSVDNNGGVRALKAGTATITVTSVDGAFSASCVITVIVDVTEVTLSEASLSITEGKSVSLIATILPEDASNKGITWKSSDESVASVSQEGVVTGNKVGKTVIKVKTSDQGKEARCEVTVTSAENIQYNPYGDKQQW